MRLGKLAVRGFGALQAPTALVFDGSSAVILGRNEAGKTAFLDALTAALFGPPERGKGTSEGKLFAARYGERGFAAEAEWIGDGGAPRRSTISEPTAAEALARELFANLLVLRAGECTLHGKGQDDSAFMAGFGKAVLGAGAVDLDGALKLLQKVVDPKGGTKWSKKEKSLREALLQSRQKVESLGRLREACLGRDAEGRALSDLQAALEEAEKESDLAERAAGKAESDHLASDRADWENALREAAGAGLPAQGPTLAGLQGLEKARAEAEKDAASSSALREGKAREASKLEAELGALKDRVAGLPDKVLRERLRDALRRCEVCEAAARSAGPGVSAALEWVLLGLAAMVGLALGWILAGRAWVALSCGAVGASLGWMAGRLLKGHGAAGAGSEREGLAADLRAVAASLGWPAQPEQARGRLEGCDKEEAQAQAKLAACRSALESARQEASTLGSDAEAAGSKAAQAAKALAESLAACGAASVADFASRQATWQSHKRKAGELEASLRRKLGLDAGAPTEALKTALQRRISELEGAAGALPAEWARMKRDALKARLQAARSERDGIARRMESHRRESERFKVEAAGLQSRLGGDEASILKESHGRRRAVEEFALWRRAADEAVKTVRRLSTATGSRMAELAVEAGPLFAELTGGRYAGLKLKGGSVFDAGALAAVHGSLGDKPVEWLSSGTQDVLWLALRIALAQRLQPAGGLLVLDEPFLTLDPGRAEAAFKALFGSERLKGWQVLVLTKDPALGTLARAAGVQVRELG
ncbi:MAG: AAA family ATPase [Elusimicrobia bacterium]|nr:AAA family ATPase [Elusimicrobiota bacterium]